jgi:hypothetical protein
MNITRAGMRLLIEKRVVGFSKRVAKDYAEFSTLVQGSNISELSAESCISLSGRRYTRFRAKGGLMRFIWDDYLNDSIEDIAPDILGKKANSRYGNHISIYSISPRTGFFEIARELDLTERFRKTAKIA